MFDTVERQEELIEAFAKGIGQPVVSLEDVDMSAPIIGGSHDRGYRIGHVTLSAPTSEEPRWLVSIDVSVPGVRTFPNGDPGYPDDADVIEAGGFDTLEDALRKVGAMIVEGVLEATIDVIRDRIDQEDIIESEKMARSAGYGPAY